MKLFIFKAVLCLLGTFLFVGVAQAVAYSEAERLQDFEQLVANIRTSYAPLNYKTENQIVNVDTHIAEFRERVIQAQSNRDFYYSLVEFVAGFHDGHFGVQIPSDYAKSVGFTTDLIDGKVLITSVDRKKLSEESFPYSIGDEVVSVNQQPMGGVLDDLSRYIGSGYALSERRFASWFVTMPVPDAASVDFEIRKGTSYLTETVTLSWEVEGKALDEDDDFFKVEKSKTKPVMNWGELSLMDSLAGFGPDHLDAQYMCSGKSRIARPKEATVLLEEPFVAYYFPTEKGNLGYLRIPHYSWTSPDGKPQFEERFLQYEYAVSELEKNTVGLIIDQDHNCGGSVEFLEQMASLFMAKEFIPLTFRIRGSKETYVSLRSWQKEFPKNSIGWFALEDMLDLVKRAWSSGEHLTDTTTFSPYTKVQPHSIRYTHPIIMLIDELSGSGGDAFPALLQGNGRAQLLGVRTSGLGGHVEAQANLWNSQLSMRMTRSLFYRPDGVAVENNGATPDIDYRITREDVMYGYRIYFDFAKEKLLGLL
jgi:C-terminal processing protease CtpA/Prc